MYSVNHSQKRGWWKQIEDIWNKMITHLDADLRNYWWPCGNSKNEHYEDTHITNFGLVAPKRFTTIQKKTSSLMAKFSRVLSARRRTKKHSFIIPWDANASKFGWLSRGSVPVMTEMVVHVPLGCSAKTRPSNCVMVPLLSSSFARRKLDASFHLSSG